MSALLLTSLLAIAAPLPAAAQEVHAFNVVAADSASAIRSFGVQAGIQILASADDLKGKKLNPVSGRISTEQALNDLLAGTGLDHRYVGDRAVALVADSTANGAEQDQARQAGKDKPTAEAVDTKNTRSDKIRLAQVDQGTSSNPPKKSEQPSEKKPIWIEEVVVTGSRIPTQAKEGPQEVKSYTREQIEQSGQTTIGDFLNTLPSVSISTTTSGFTTAHGDQTVQLRGLPQGKTLVLIDGRRVETSGSESAHDFFDLNNIPLAAVERIEVVADGSSAIYGSDAIAGVVNVVLKKNVDGVEVSGKYGGASGIDGSDISLLLGRHWENGSFMIIGSYQTSSELDTTERALSATNDYRQFGARNRNFPTCSPGNVFSVNGSPLPGAPAGSNATYAAVSGTATSGKPSFADFNYGTLNDCSILSGASLIPAMHRTGIIARGDYEIASSVKVFTELMFSHLQSFQYTNYPYLFGQAGFQSFTVSASNPYNPFGTTVGIGELLTGLPRQGQPADTDFFRPLIGATGDFFDAWHWELTAWESRDRTNVTLPLATMDSTAIQNALNSSDPSTALNPFVAGLPGPQSLLQSYFSDQLVKFSSHSESVSGFLRGPVFRLPAGPVELVVGSEYSRDTLYSDEVNVAGVSPNLEATFHRHSYAVFGEARIPILANAATPQAGDTLAVTLAGRHDSYNDFGTRNTPQFGAEWRPSRTLLIRATYAEAFKAPPLYSLYGPQFTFSGAVITDPLTGQAETVTEVSGGNPHLRAETGQSHTFGLVYSSQAIPDFHLSITNWTVNENNTIESLQPQVLVDNPNLFPGAVIRSTNCGQSTCPITQVNATQVNFGALNVAGFDYQVNYQYHTRFGVLTPALSATQTYHYTAALAPNVPSTERVSKASDDNVWAPRWKGTAALGWKLGPYTANVDGRYVSRYQDFDSTREIGNFWICDANFRYAIGQALASNSGAFKSAYVAVGGVNLFNRLPQFSNAGGGFYGYDATQADIRGRFLYFQIGGKW